MATILMTLAETKAPSSYELLIRLLTLGRRNKIYQYIRGKYLKENHVILDSGCGTGKFLEIAELEWTNTVGLDISENMLEHAQKKASKRKKPFVLIRGSITTLPFRKESFDMISSFLVLSELISTDVEMAIKEAILCLKHNGLLIIVTESKPSNLIKRILFNLIRAPAYVLASLLTKTPKHPVHNLSDILSKYSGSIIEEKEYLGGHLTLFVLKKH
jgi:ubiquinone/menaquinone biosynthesis C-methylase UbiE